MNTAVLSYSVRGRVVLRYFGELCLVLAALTLAPFAVAVYFQETSASLRYALVIAMLGALGGALMRFREPKRVQTNEGMVVVALIFLFAPLALSYPAMATGLSFIDALFENVSGVTTTGLTIMAEVEQAPTSLLFARSWMQWYGGLGVVILSLAFVEAGAIAKGLAATQSGADDLVGGMRAHARRSLAVYAALTVAGIGLFSALGMEPLHAVLYGLAAVSTGGFAPHNRSLAGWESEAGWIAVIFVSFLGAVPLVIYYAVVRRRWRSSVNILQLKALVTAGVCLSGLFALTLAMSTSIPWSRLLYHAPLMALSAQFTAGFSTMSLAEVPAEAKALLILAMTIGGGAGSTAGGVKILRLLIFMQLLRVAIQKPGLAPHAILEPRIAGHRLEESEQRKAMIIIVLFFGTIFASWLVFLFMGYDALDSLFEVASATATVGLSTGIAQAELPDALKGLLCFNMLMGRIEFLPWLVSLRPSTWFGPTLEDQ